MLYKSKSNFWKNKKKEEKNKAEEFFKKYQHKAMESQKINMQHCNLRELYDSLLSESQKLNQRSKQDKEIISELKIGAGKHQERLLMYGDALKKAEENIANLSDKNLFLTQEKAELTGQLKQVFATT